MQSRTSDIRTGRFGAMLARQGIEPKLVWGFVGLMFFMVGDGLELAYLSATLSDQGYTQGQIGILLTAYGVTVAIASWLAGAVSAGWGPRRVMMAGFVIWFVFQVLFVYFGVVQGNYELGLITYTIRGLAYPLFAYGFLSWVTMSTPEKTLGRAAGWYWFFSSCGMGVIGAYWAGFMIPVIGEISTLWTSLVFVTIGAALVFFLVRDVPIGDRSTKENLRQAAGAVTIVFEHPKVGVGGAVRMINTVAVYAFAVFLPTYMTQEIGFKIEGWQFIWGTMQLANIAGNVLNGYLGDRFGRVRTVRWVGCIGTAATVLLILWMAMIGGPSYPLMLIAVVCYGFTLAAFVPLSAIVPLLARENKASAIAILNLGAGLAHIVGALIPTLFLGSIGITGVFLVIAAVYVVGFGLTYFLNPGKREQAVLDQIRHQQVAGVQGPDTDTERVGMPETPEAVAVSRRGMDESGA